MRKCSEIKRLNGDNKFRSELNEMLNLCRQSGHRPVRGTDVFRRLASIEHAMYIRTTKNIPVPSDIMALISDIKAFPSLAEKQQAEIVMQAKKEQGAFDARYQKVVEIFPLVKLLRVIYDEDLYQRFINADFNAVAVKYISDCVNNAVRDITLYGNVYKTHVDILCKSAGIGITESDIQKIQYLYIQNDVSGRREPTTDGLNNFELGFLYSKACEGIRYRITKVQRWLRIKLSDVEKGISMYVSGDVNGLVRTIPNNFRQMYKMQFKTNIVDIPTSDLLILGKLFVDTGSKPVPKTQKVKRQKETSAPIDNKEPIVPVDSFAVNYPQIKRLFPKIDILRDMLNKKQFKDFIEQPINPIVIQAMSDRIENRIKDVRSLGWGPTLERDLDMYLKFNGFGVTDMDVETIKSFYRMKGMTDKPVPSITGLKHDELACLYGISEGTVSNCINKMRNKLQRWYGFSLHTAVTMYIMGHNSKLIEYLKPSLKEMYEFEEKYNMTKMPLDELLSAGRELYKNSIYCNAVKER